MNVSDAALCAGGGVAIGPAPVNGYTYLWSPSTGLSAANVAQPWASPTADTAYTVTVTNPANGATGSATVHVTVHALPTVTASAPTTISSGGQTTLSADASGGTSPYAYAWTGSAASCANASCLSDGTAAQPVASPSETSDFTVAVTDVNGCQARATTTVTVAAPVAVSVTPAQGICAGDSVTLAADATGGVPGYTFAWTSDVACSAPDCISDPGVASPTVTPAATTTFSVLATDSLGATASGQTTLTVLPNPGTAGADAFLTPGGSLQIGPAPVSGATYGWTCNRPDCALSDATAAQPMVSPIRSTTYALDATTGAGCDRQTQLTVWSLLGQTSRPAVGTVWPVSAKLQVQFDQDLDPAAIDPTLITLTDATTGAVIPVTLGYDATSRILTVTPPASGSSGYASGTTYTLTLTSGSSGVRSSDPVLPSIFSDDQLIDFDTGAADATAPTVVSQSPAANAVNVALNSRIQAAFSEPLDPASVNGTTVTLIDKSGPVSGTVHYDFGSQSLEYVPDAPLTANDTYTVTIAGVTDLSGNAGTASWMFSTGASLDTTPPTVVAVSPVTGATNALVSTTVQLTFSEPLDTTTLGGVSLVNTATGAKVGGTVSYNATTQVLTFTPSAFLAGSTTYEIDASGMADLAGNVMADYQSTFTTQRVLFHDDFEAGNGQWALPAGTNSAVTWGLSTKQSRSPTHSLTDSPNGKYANNNTSTATVLSPIDVTGVNTATVLFSMMTRLEKAKDFVYVEYTLDGGTTWTSLANPATGTPGWSGNLGWTPVQLSIPVNGATALQFRFRLTTNQNRNFDGVYVDDVYLQAP